MAPTCLTRQDLIEAGLLVPMGHNIPVLRMRKEDQIKADYHMMEYWLYRHETGEEEMEWGMRPEEKEHE